MERPAGQHLTDRSTWLRGLFMVVFALVWQVAELVLLLVAVIQFGFRLFTGSANAELASFGQDLATYLYQIVLFLTFRSEDKPFPFSSWPSGPPPGPRALPVAVDPPTGTEDDRRAP
jgi:hypothetical protein